MTREILFRGKRLDNGEWVESWTLHRAKDKDGNVRAFLGAGKKAVFIFDNYRNIITVTALEGYIDYSVDPSTVGQFTGLCDKNGKKIFEGDTARYGDDLVVIEWHDEDAMFYTRGLDGTNWTTNFNEINGYDLEIVGNIHDNPELLEG